MTPNLHRLDIEKMQTAPSLVDDPKQIKVIGVELKALRKMINLFYIGFCEYIGPGKTDALLAKAVTRLKFHGGAAFSDIFAKLL